jgi:hypothetical protein
MVNGRNVKIYNTTYLNKIFLHHEWLNQEIPTSKFPIPMQPNARYQQKLESVDIPTQAYSFGYRQAIGELIYTLVTCRPDISYPVIKLSQYSVCPNAINFKQSEIFINILTQQKMRGFTSGVSNQEQIYHKVFYQI